MNILDNTLEYCSIINGKKGIFLCYKVNNHWEHCDNQRNQWLKDHFAVIWKSTILERLVNVCGLDGACAGNGDIMNEYAFAFWSDKNALKFILTIPVLALWI